MRSSKSRSRSKGNRNNRNVGNVVNRVFDSSGPEGKVRGTPQQIIDKYNQLTRDAQLSNDRVAAENFQQHAEHYTRMLAEAMREQQERQERQQQNQQNQPNQNQPNQNQPNQNTQNQPRRGDDGGSQDNQQSKKQQHAAPASEQPKPKSSSDVIDLEQGNEVSGLVETPEEKPARPRRTRKKAPTSDSGGAPDQPTAPKTDAAE